MYSAFYYTFSKKSVRQFAEQTFLLFYLKYSPGTSITKSDTGKLAHGCK